MPIIPAIGFLLGALWGIWEFVWSHDWHDLLGIVFCLFFGLGFGFIAYAHWHYTKRLYFTVNEYFWGSRQP